MNHLNQTTNISNNPQEWDDTTFLNELKIVLHSFYRNDSGPKTINYVVSMDLLHEQRLHSDGVLHKDIIYSLYPWVSDISVKGILNSLRERYMYDSMSIVFIDWEDISPQYQVYNVEDCMNRFHNLHIRSYNYINFFLHIEELLKDRHIFIFKSVHWSNILLIFRLHYFLLNGGTISSRQNLSRNQYHLSHFIHLLDLDTSDNYFYKYANSYNLTNKIDRTFLKSLRLQYKKTDDSENKIHLVIKEYLKMNLLHELYVAYSILQREEDSLIYNIHSKDIDMNDATTLRLDSIKKDKSELKFKYSQLSTIDYDDIIKYLNKLRTKNKGVRNQSINKGVRGQSVNKGRRSYSTQVENRSNVFSINSFVYNELIRIIRNEGINENTQLLIETFLLKQGRIFTDKDYNEESDINYNKLNGTILNIVRNSMKELNKLLNFKRIYYNETNFTGNKDIHNNTRLLLNYFDNSTIIEYLLGRLLKIISNNKLINPNTIEVNLAIDLSKDLVNKYIYDHYNKEVIRAKSDGQTYVGYSVFKQNNMEQFKSLSKDEFLLHFGIHLFNSMEECNLIRKKIVQNDYKEKRSIWLVSTSLETAISNSKENGWLFNDLPFKIPMLVKPKEYTFYEHEGKNYFKLGGYLLNDVEFISPIIIPNVSLKHQSTLLEHSGIHTMINNLSSVGFKINNQVLDFILNNGIKFNLITDPSQVHPLEYKEKLSKVETSILDTYLSKQNLDKNIIGMANIFKYVPEFYIPIRMDNRGRVYASPSYLNYQSTELAKALLLFSKEEKIYKSDSTAINYLKIFGANCYDNGVKKNSFEDRIKWVNDHEYDILNFENGVLLNRAESKLLFLAFCFEYIKYKNSLLNDNTYYMSNFPIQLDATCNGFQHLALLTGDDSLAKQLNLSKSNSKDMPEDFYKFMTIKLKDHFRDEIKKYENSQNSDNVLDNKLISYKKLNSLSLTRKIVKPSVMVKPYNASLYQMGNYIKDKFEKSLDQGYYVYTLPSNPEIKLNEKDFMILSMSIDKVISNEFPKLIEFIDYLNNIAKICIKLNIPIVWTVPSGLNINQYYMDSEAIRLKPFSNRKITYSLMVGNKKLHKSKQVRALMPNLIHSLDASSLALLANIFFDLGHANTNFYSIHDCFAVTSNNVSKLIDYIKLVYIAIYSNDTYILKFDKGIIDSIKYHFGENAYNSSTKTISINTSLNSIVLDYPDVNKVVYGTIKADSIKSSNYILE